VSSGKSVRLSALSRNASAYSRSGSQLRRCGFFAGFARPLNPRRALCTVDSLGLGAAVGSMGRVSAYEQRNMLQLHIVLQRSTDVAIPRAGVGAVHQRMHADARDKHWCARCQLGAELHANEVRSGATQEHVPAQCKIHTTSVHRCHANRCAPCAGASMCVPAPLPVLPSPARRCAVEGDQSIAAVRRAP
jgi:hypothetical protein